MRYLFAIVLLLLATPTVAQPVTHVASVDFVTSPVQDSGGWSYRDGNGPLPTLLMSGPVVVDHGPTWQGSEAYLFLWKDGGHPGAIQDAIRRWTPPTSGIVTVSGTAQSAAATVDGVRVQIKANGVTLYEHFFVPGEVAPASYSLANVSVTPTAPIDFVINRGGTSNSGDSMKFDPTVTFTPATTLPPQPDPCVVPTTTVIPFGVAPKVSWQQPTTDLIEGFTVVIDTGAAVDISLAPLASCPNGFNAYKWQMSLPLPAGTHSVTVSGWNLGGLNSSRQQGPTTTGSFVVAQPTTLTPSAPLNIRVAP